jgi:hypothetical protein
VKWAVLVAVASGASVASAAPRTAQLSYAGDACAAGDLVKRVRELVGRDPFVTTDATLKIDVHVDTGPRATVSIAGRGQRELVASTCGELVDALALVIAIDVSGDQPTTVSGDQPTTVSGDQRTTVSVDQPTSSESVLDPRPGPDSPAADSSIREHVVRGIQRPPVARVRVDSDLARVATESPRSEAPGTEAPRIVSLVGGLGASTRGTPSGAFGARLGRGWWSIEGVVGIGAPESHPMIDVVRGGAAVAACVHVGLASACPMASAGWVVGRGHDLARAETATTPAAGAGMRLAVERGLVGGFGLRARIDGTVSMTSTTFTVDDVMVWESPRTELVFGIDMLAQIP